MDFISLFALATELASCIWLQAVYFVSPFYLSVQIVCKTLSTLEFLLILSVKTIRCLLIKTSSLILYVTSIVTRIEHFLESKMEPKAAELLAVLKNNNLAIDVKVSHLLGIKSDIKQKNVPDAAISLIFECLRLAIGSHHSGLYAAGFSTLGHFLKRLFIQDQPNLISAHARHFYPILLERLGDHKERVRSQAAQIFTDLWPAAGPEVEHYVLEVALTGKNPKAKEMSLLWLSNMSKNHGLLFRSYVPSLVSCLEDADSVVRDTAKSTTVELFRSAPARAKSDLTKEMSTQNVRKSIVNAIIANIGLEDDASVAIARPLSRTEPRPTSRVETQPPRPVSRVEVVRQRPPAVSHSHPPSPPELPVEPIPILIESEPLKRRPGSSKSEQEQSNMTELDGNEVLPFLARYEEGDSIKPLKTGSGKHIDSLFRAMAPAFEGRETEQNWILREKYMTALRQLTYGNSPRDFPQHFYAGIKSLLDGIFKTVTSLRTTTSANGCLLIQDLAKVCGPKLDPMVEIMMQNLIKLCSGMKKISTQNGNLCVDALLANVSYTPRLLHHVTRACEDKNLQLRLYAAGWLKTLINKQARHKSSIEHGGGLNTIEKTMKNGFSDANPGVREAMRGVFWTFYRVWPTKGDGMLSDLDHKTRSLLEKDPANPIPGQTGSQSSPGKGTPSSRSTLKEAIAAHKKAYVAAAKGLPPRPESAQSSFSATKPTDLPAKATNARTVPTGAPVSSLSSAPMRPGAKARRPELARPATADPYASRRSAATDTRPKTPAPAPAPAEGSPRLRHKKSTPLKPLSVVRTRPKADLAQPASAKIKTAEDEARKARQFQRLAKLDNFTIQKIPDSRDAGFHVTAAVPQPHLDHWPEDLDESPFPSDVLQSTPDHQLHPSNANNESKVPDSYPPKEYRFVPIFDDRSSTTDNALHSSNVINNENKVSESPPTKEHAHVPIFDDQFSPKDNALGELPTTEPDLQSTPDHLLHSSSAINNENKVPESPPTKEHAHMPIFDDQSSSKDNALHSSNAMKNKNTVSESTPPKQNASMPILDDRSLSRDNALGELPSNESDHRDNKAIDPFTTPRQDRQPNTPIMIKRSLSLRSQQLPNAQEIVRVAGQRIRSKALDLFAYRKLQNIIVFHGESLFDQSVFDDLCQALLEELRSESDSRSKSHGDYTDLKNQVLLTVRRLHIKCPNFFGPYCPQALTAVLDAIRYFESYCWIVTDLQYFAGELVRLCEKRAFTVMLDTLVDYAHKGTRDDRGYRAILTALTLLTELMDEAIQDTRCFPSEILEKIGSFVITDLLQGPTPARRQAIQLCVKLHRMAFDKHGFDDGSFWGYIGNPNPVTRNLVAYYVVRGNE
ncbi:suppressor of tub2 mutation [Aspergillus alliaceus]|uniref:Suppressor of tub2 mutation n=1 Tax=Petromyces alliaceus TaxID=209559 RepID=A0A8H6E3F5_PETAA|nr:suppressor of tub2 mutation [Aspergillus burnettii]